MSVNICIEPSSVATGLASLYQKQQLTDVRLVCSDGQLSAHRPVLAAVSERLRLLFADQTDINREPTLLLTDTLIADIKTIVDCLYFGHQTIPSTSFAHLSRIAARLGIELRSSVSIALKDIVQQPERQRPLPPTPHPKSGRQSGILSNDKKQISRRGDQLVSQMDVTSEDCQMDDLFPDEEIPDASTPLDLSAPKPTPMDNLSRIIDLVATNGPTIKRQRKQSSPKAVIKTVRFDETVDSMMATNPNSTIDELIASDQISDTDSAPESLRVEADKPEADKVTEKMVIDVPQKPTTAPLAIEVPLKPTIAAPKVVQRSKPIGRPPKTAINSGDDIKECYVCDLVMAGHKQLIAHLNRFHKTDNIFKCICGKEQKYAKTFATHYVQCERMVRNK